MSNNYNSTPEDQFILEAFPDSVTAAMEAHKGRLLESAAENEGQEFLVSTASAWAPGETIRVAFRGGDTSLHRDIAKTAQAISEVCSLKLDFGFNEATGTFRTWSVEDKEYAAEIRIGFDQSGYFSLVGTDCVNPELTPKSNPVGGRPNQLSLNLGGYDREKPFRWQGTVLHELLHALSFHHEHQNLRGPCQESFRWENDAGYVPTQDQRGQFISDVAGRRPGIYTYLAGFPNFWSRSKVDHNLRAHEEPGQVAGPFDAASVMLYRFPNIFYKTVPSACAPSGTGESLSDGDISGLRLLYPRPGDDAGPAANAAADVAARLAPVEAPASGAAASALGVTAKRLNQRLRALRDHR